MNNEPRFPIMTSENVKPHPMSVPWSIAELAYSRYAARYGTSQSLRRLAERGGFGANEMDIFLPDGGTAAEQADVLKRVAFQAEFNGTNILPYDLSEIEKWASNGGKVKFQVWTAEMAEYDHRKLADAWYSGTGAASRSSNALARATQIEHNRLVAILLGEKQATVKELDAICEELNVSLESVRADAE